MKRPHLIGPALPFLLPNFLGFLAFTAWPVLAAVLLAFTAWDLVSSPQWVGFQNFSDLLGFTRTSEGIKANDPLFWKYLYNTVFLMLMLPVNIMGSLALAMLLNRKLKGATFYRLAFFLPSILSGVAIFYLWRWMYNPDFGLVNSILASVGISGPGWLTNPSWAKPALMVMGSWISIGGTSMILYFAALQNVPAELHEAAAIDGAGVWAQFLHITWPSVAPVTFFILTMGLIHGFQAGFEMAYIMTGGGPFGATTTLGFYIYDKAYVQFEMGYAAAIACVMFVLVLGVTLLNWKFGKGKIQT